LVRSFERDDRKDEVKANSTEVEPLEANVTEGGGFNDTDATSEARLLAWHEFAHDEEDRYVDLRHDLPRFVPSEEELVALTNIGRAVNTAMTVSLVAPFFLQIFANKAMKSMWPTLNALQIALSLPLLAVETPANVLVVQEQFIKTINMEIIDKDKVYAWIFGVPLDESEAKEVASAPEEITGATPEDQTAEGENLDDSLEAEGG